MEKSLQKNIGPSSNSEGQSPSSKPSANFGSSRIDTIRWLNGYFSLMRSFIAMRLIDFSMWLADIAIKIAPKPERIAPYLEKPNDS